MLDGFVVWVASVRSKPVSRPLHTRHAPLTPHVATQSRSPPSPLRLPAAPTVALAAARSCAVDS
eukprot:3525351-Prymnesium_polylepis.1